MGTPLIATTALRPIGHPFCDTDGLHFTQRSTPHKDGHASHCHNGTSALRASILRHGWITLHTAFHSAQGWTRFTLPQRHFRPRASHLPTGKDSTSQTIPFAQRWERLSLPQRRFGPSGIHSATRMDYTSHSVPLRARMGMLHIATTALLPFGHPFCNTDGLHFTQRSTPRKDGHASHCHNGTSA